MKEEKLDGVAITVKNLDKAIQLFSDVFGATFEKLLASGVKRSKVITEHANRAFEETQLEAALGPMGLELVETVPPAERSWRSASNCMRTVTSPVGIDSVETCV